MIFSSKKKDLNARNQVKGAKPKMRERKLKSCVNWQRGFTAKKEVKKGRKTRDGFYLYTVQRYTV